MKVIKQGILSFNFFKTKFGWLESQSFELTNLFPLPNILRYLTWPNEEIQIAGFNLISNMLVIGLSIQIKSFPLTFSNSPFFSLDKNRNVFLEHRGIELSVSALQTSNSLLQDAILSILEPLAFTQAASRMNDSALSIRLFSLLNSPHLTVKRRSIKIISELARNPQIQKLFCDRKVIPILIHLFRDLDEETQESAAFTLYFISSSHACRSEIVSAEGFPNMLPLLNSLHKSTVEQTLSALANFAADKAFIEVITRILLKDILNCLHSPQATIASVAMKILIILSRHGKIHRFGRNSSHLSNR